MRRPHLLIKPWPTQTRLLLTFGNEEVMRAQLPPPPSVHPRAAQTLCEGLSLWLGQPLFVVLCADEAGTSSALNLCDGFGFGNKTVHYEVEVVDPRLRPRPLGSFRDLSRILRRLRGGQ